MTANDGFPFAFRCRRTGNCCARPDGVVRVTAADVARVAEHLGLAESAFRSRYVAPSGDRLVGGAGPACVFLEEGRPAACSIHPVRPEQCRTWPFWDEMRDPETLRRAMRFCPGIEPRPTSSTGGSRAAGRDA